MRPPAEAQRIIGYLILAQAIFGVAFAWVYFQGKEDKPWLTQGIRFGIAIAALTVIPTYLIYHVVTPVPFALALKQIVYDTIRVVLMGIVLAWINRSPASRRTMDLSAQAAAADLARRMVPFWQDALGPELLGVYLIGSLAHGGFSARYSDVDVAVITEAGVPLPVLDRGKREAVALSADWVRRRT